MWTVKDMFYGQADPVWITKPEKEESKRGDSGGSSGGSSSKKPAARTDDTILSSIPYYPYYHPDYVPPPTPARKEESKTAPPTQRKETRVVMKVPICCGECVESVEAALYGVRGIKSVECDTYREKVTVIATTAAPAEILMVCRRVFKRSRLWTDDD